MYLTGKYVDVNLARAEAYLKRAAVNHSVEAYFRLWKLYEFHIKNEENSNFYRNLYLSKSARVQ